MESWTEKKSSHKMKAQTKRVKGEQWQCIAKLKEKLNPRKEHKLHEFVEIKVISF